VAIENKNYGFSYLAWPAAFAAGLIVWFVVVFLLPRMIAAPVPDVSVFLPQCASLLKPEPAESIGYLFALVFPPLLYFFVLKSSNRFHYEDLFLPALLCQAFLFIFTLWLWRFQYTHIRAYFPVWMLFLAFITGGVGALFCVLALVFPPFKAQFGSRFPAKALRGLFLAAGAGALVCGLLPALFTDGNIASAFPIMRAHLPYTLGEFAAVVNGRTPCVDFFPQYQNLMPYAWLPYFKVFGLSVFTYTFGMALLSAAGLAMMWLVFQKLTGDGAKGALLFLVFAGISFYGTKASETERFYVFNYYAAAPIRYIALWAVGLLVVMFSEKRSLPRLVFLFLAAGLFALNNPDFGIPAFVAAGAACLTGGGAEILQPRRESMRVLAAASGGLVCAVIIFLCVTVLRSGRFPDLVSILRYPAIFSCNGFMALPLRAYGLHLVLLFTFMGALFAGMTPSLKGSPKARVFLVFIGVSSCGVGMYYVSRSHASVLPALFPAWGAAVCALLFYTLDSLFKTEQEDLLTGVSFLLPLWFEISLAALFLLQLFTLNAPAKQFRRLASASNVFAGELEKIERIVLPRVVPGEKIMLICGYGHLIAVRNRLDNVYPYASGGSLILRAQAEETAKRAKELVVRTVFGVLPDGAGRIFENAGFTRTEFYPELKFGIWQNTEERRGD